MTKEEKQRREEDFEWWITCIPDKIEKLKSELPKKVSEKLDFSLESLDILEGFIIKNFTVDYLKSEHGSDILDRFSSYFGSSIKKLIPSTKWHCELENDKDIYFGLPVLISSSDSALSPYHLPITAIIRKKGDFISTIVKKRTKNNV